MTRFKSVVALIGSLVFMSAVGPVGAPAATAATSATAGDVVDPGTAPPIRVSTYNLCGNACPDGTLPETDLRESTVAAEGQSGWNADVVFLQEICKYQYDDIAVRLPGFTGHYVETVPTGAIVGGRVVCRDRSSYGMAVFAKGTLHTDPGRAVVDERDGVVDLDLNGYTTGPDPTRLEPEDITSPCMRVFVQNRSTWVCSVHLYWGSESVPAEKALRDAEAVRLYERVKRWQDEGVPVILGGDFNTQPWNTGTQPFYSDRAHSNTLGTGRMTEVDETDNSPGFFQSVCAGKPRCRSGEPTRDDTVAPDPNGNDTADRKIDYIFFSTQFFDGVLGDALPVDRDISDHAILRGAARWTDCVPAAPGAGAVFRVDANGALDRYAGRSNGTIAPACRVGSGWSSMKRTVRQGSALLAVGGTGALWRYPADPATGTYSSSTRTAAGSGFAGAAGPGGALLAPGDTDHDGYPDLLVRDALGDLWRYPGSAGGTYTQQTAVKLDGPAPGRTWGDYTMLVAPGDFATDAANAPDLVGMDAAGYLWLHKGTAVGTYGPPVQIGHGWQIYNALAAPGDIDGDGKPDLVARDRVPGKTYGYLWFYRGNGTGGYEPRVKIGNGYPDSEPLF
ncbi:endonuclease/exonuclease/phosphatase family protein [Streptomyces tsukubensis]